MIDSVATPETEVPMEQLRDLVRQAVADGDLTTTAPASRIRSYLRGRGLRCTPVQSRQLRDQLRPPRGAADTFGRRLTAARLARGLTQCELARIADCSESYLSYLEADARSPSPRLLTALAEALRREPEWLRSGEESPATRRITSTLQKAWAAFHAADWQALDRHVAQLLDGDPGRPLHHGEQETAALLRGRAYCATGRDLEAIDLLTPLVEDVVKGGSDVSPVLLGQGYVRALINTADGHVAALAHAWMVGQQLLAAAPSTRDDDWWRLAATLMGIHFATSPMDLAAAQGEWWLTELRREGEDVHPSGAAALHWNLALTDIQRGDLGQALGRITTALDLQDSSRYPGDAARLQMVYGGMLARAGGRGTTQAVQVLESCRDALVKHGYHGDRTAWTLIRARAAIAAQNLTQALVLLDELVSSETTDDTDKVDAWISLAECFGLIGRRVDVLDALREAGSLLSRSPMGAPHARQWRALGDLWSDIGDGESAATAYRQALDLMHVSRGIR